MEWTFFIILKKKIHFFASWKMHFPHNISKDEGKWVLRNLSWPVSDTVSPSVCSFILFLCFNVCFPVCSFILFRCLPLCIYAVSFIWEPIHFIVLFTFYLCLFFVCLSPYFWCVLSSLCVSLFISLSLSFVFFLFDL